MRGMWWVVGVVLVVVLVGTYLTWIAGRVDRLHARAAAASSALDAQLVRRAVAASALGEAVQQTGLAHAARVALDARPGERETAENDLTRQLRGVVLDADDPVVADLVAVSRRVALARQVHTDVVRDALAVRRLRPVRLLGLNRRHPEPAYFDVDDPSLGGAARATVSER